MREKRNDIPQPLQSVCEHLSSHGIHHIASSEGVQFDFDSGNTIERCVFKLSSSGDILEIHVKYPLKIAQERRQSVADFITRANYGMILGNFQMDFVDGEIGYHVAHVLENSTVSDELIQRLFSAALRMADRYFPALMQHLHGGMTPEDAVYLAELDLHAARPHLQPDQENRNLSAKRRRKRRRSE